MTGTEQIAIHLDGVRSADFRRFLVLSLIGHLVLVGAFAFTPEPTSFVPKGVVAVELVALSGPPAAAPAPAPPAPVPLAPPKPKPEKVVLPAEPKTPKVPDKPKPKKVEQVKPPPPKPTPKPERDYEDIMAELRAASGEEAPKQVARAAPAAVTGPVGSPDGVSVSPEVAAWIRRVKVHVKRNFVVPPGFRGQFLEAAVDVDLDASGAIRGGPRVTRPSGNPWYDEGVMRAIQKSAPLPAPPDAGTWTFSFTPQDSY